MKLAEIYSTLKNEPLFCIPGYRETLLEMFQQHAALSADEYKATRTGKARSGDSLEIEQMEIEAPFARIPIGGPIMQKAGEFEKGAGAVDVDDVADELDEAEANDEVQTIILNFDTPGGMHKGTPELGTRIQAVEKPIYAWSRGQISSAGYWLASCTDGIFCTPSADIGCIGVCCSFMDFSKMAEMKGIKVKVFGSGDYKGMGTQGTSLTAKQEMLLQNRVEMLAQVFYDHVTATRGAIDIADMQGQTFKGPQALEKGFVDGVMNSLAELEAFLR